MRKVSARWIAACVLLFPSTLVMIYFAVVAIIYGNARTPLVAWGLILAVVLGYAANIYAVIAWRPRQPNDSTS